MAPFSPGEPTLVSAPHSTTDWWSTSPAGPSYVASRPRRAVAPSRRCTPGAEYESQRVHLTESCAPRAVSVVPTSFRATSAPDAEFTPRRVHSMCSFSTHRQFHVPPVFPGYRRVHSMCRPPSARAVLRYNVSRSMTSQFPVPGSSPDDSSPQYPAVQGPVMEGNVIELSSDSSAPPSPIPADSSGCLDIPVQVASEAVHDDLPSVSDVEEGLGISQPRQRIHCVSDSDESVIAVECEDLPVSDNQREQSHQEDSATIARKRPRVQNVNMAGRRQATEEERNLKEGEEQQKKLEMEQKTADLQFNKLVKIVVADRISAMKRAECIKSVLVHLESLLVTDVYGGELLAALQGAEFQYEIQSMVIPRMVTWTRKVPRRKLSEIQKWQVNVDLVIVQEEEILVVRPWNEIVELVHSGELCTRMQALKTILPENKLTLVIYGMDQYFRYQKACKNREFRGRVLGTDAASCKGGTTKELSMDTAHIISRDQLDEALAEVQLFANCCHRLVESPSALAALVTQFTKAVAEKPYKIEKQLREQRKLSWFAAADSRDCVRVDENGNGLLSLWKQQLCQFNLATLETAEAVASKYQNPQALIQAYNQCTSQQSAELLLQDIPIQRALGPLTSTRRLGPELSKKIHRFFTAEKGDTPLSQD